MDKILILAMGAAIVTFSVLILRAHPAMGEIEWQQAAHQVQAGDSLWSIAHEYCPKQADRRGWIKKVQVLNDLHDDTIHPGQWITVLKPAKE